MTKGTGEFGHHFSRRRFLRWTAAAGVGSILGWRFVLPSVGLGFGPLARLSQSEARILAAAFRVITLETDEAEVRRAVEFMDRFAGNLSSRDFFEFRAALVLVEQSPLVFHGYLGRFTALDEVRQRACLEGWRRGAAWRRPVFGALKELSYLYYYTQPLHWAAIGYQGPLVGPGGAGPAYEARYAGLIQS